ncbi:phosphatase PAP2 family protein [Rhodoferax antarcticus]|uniref:phosphatase PAP2 family protein n=1 Tax=Rhodoferax antarcticus TaxID=81479 RepID=UPI0022255188|nr:phosphatase PAP2 family protein [Rhodoferax antarcticus]
MSLPISLQTRQVTAKRNPPATLWWLSLVGLTITLLWDAAGLDQWVMTQFGSPQGFALQHNWWLETVLHQWMRHLAWVFLALLALMVWHPLGFFRQVSRQQRTEMLLGTLLALLLINVIKHDSLISCPWDLRLFGGVAEYRSHWSWGVSDGGPGRCFPGGHASAALAFLALPLGLLTSQRAADRRIGWWSLTAVLLVGAVLGAAQTLRGAHFPSHTLWTALLCWTAALLNHLVWRSITKNRLRPASISPQHRSESLINPQM